MDYTSLKEITETIIAVIQQAVDDTGSWPPTFEVSPELLKDKHTGLGFYLFHVQESSHYRNFPAPGNDNPPVNYTPMALNLFYQLSANSTSDASEEDAYDEQNLMSVAMKALHDHSQIQITSTGKKINIKITLQTLSPSESVQYWAAAESPVRLSAYYEVSVVFLEPEKQLSYAGRVLTYGNFIFTRGAPQITSSENIIEYTVPLDPELKQVKISPAQAPPTTVIPAPINSIISFIGNGFGGGTTELLLIDGRWNEPAVATAPWLVTVISKGQLTTTVQETAELQKSGATVDILPGLYAAQIINIEVRTLPDSSTKEFRHSSNQFPFSVMPCIDDIPTILGPVGTTFTVKGYLFEHADLSSNDIQVYIGETKLNLLIPPATDPSAGEFKITDPTTIELKVPAEMPAGLAALRILIRGIESEPRWITIIP